MTQLRTAAGDADFVIIVGKGGTGKTTAAGALALEYADAGRPTHLISTDPAHSLGDLFEVSLTGTATPSPCSADLVLEEFDATAYADDWIGRSLPAVAALVEGGTYLDAADVLSFSRLALPGVDEMMAVLRLVDLQRAGAHVVVDTAPTGHTLRLLDAAATHEGIAHALRAMADKAAAVATGMTGRSVRLGGEGLIDELAACVATYRRDVLGRAAFIIATRPGAVVCAGTDRLADGLRERELRIVATVVSAYGRGETAPVAVAGAAFLAPPLHRATGCAALRGWCAGVQPYQQPAPVGVPAPRAPEPRDRALVLPVPAPALQPQTSAGTPGSDTTRGLRDGLNPSIRQALDADFLLFAGKGGVGKTTCAAAAALSFAATRHVLLCGTDPAGSLDDVLGPAASETQLRVLQIDPAAGLAALRTAYEADVLSALERLGISDAAALDRRVIEALWDLAPPGIDELAALAAMIDAAAGNEMVILDTAPTGHFLRLLDMPGIALDWTRQLMRIVVKYGLSRSGGVAESLLRLARQLRALLALLHDAERAGVVVVTLDQPVVMAESRRLIDALDAAGFRIAAVVHNRADGATSPALSGTGVRLVAPLLRRPIIGADALREFAAAWNIVT
jgi:arsenite/tail-anchored protein-transporting ATPase